MSADTQKKACHTDITGRGQPPHPMRQRAHWLLTLKLSVDSRAKRAWWHALLGFGCHGHPHLDAAMEPTQSLLPLTPKSSQQDPILACLHAPSHNGLRMAGRINKFVPASTQKHSLQFLHSHVLSHEGNEAPQSQVPQRGQENILCQLECSSLSFTHRLNQREPGIWNFNRYPRLS